MSNSTLKPRIVLIEDDWGRIETFKQWLAKTEFILVVTHSGGQALGLLRKGSTEAAAGMLLDHDLSDAPLTDADHRLSTSDIIPLIQRNVRRTVPILIHSHNMNKPVTMQRALESSGFSVTRIRFGVLSEERFVEWLDRCETIGNRPSELYFSCTCLWLNRTPTGYCQAASHGNSMPFRVKIDR